MSWSLTSNFFFREHCRAREQASWAKPILICLSLVTLFLCSIIIHQRKVLMYTKNYKNERKRILSNSMSKAKGFYETPNAGNWTKLMKKLEVVPENTAFKAKLQLFSGARVASKHATFNYGSKLWCSRICVFYCNYRNMGPRVWFINYDSYFMSQCLWLIYSNYDGFGIIAWCNTSSNATWIRANVPNTTDGSTKSAYDSTTFAA